MSSNKCPHCGLVSFAGLEKCKRCSAVLDPTQPQQQSARPQQVGAWRDRWWLVKHLGVPFADSCIKCSEPSDVSTADVSHQPVSVEALSAWSLLTHLVGIHVVRRINFAVPLCRRHRFGIDKVSVGLMISGAVLCVSGFVSFIGTTMTYIFPIVVFTLGILVLGVGVIAALDRDIVKAWKYKEPYIWLWGVNRNYLERLPKWSERKA